MKNLYKNQLTLDHNCTIIHNTVMWFKIDFHSGIPVYRQIVDRLIEAIAKRKFDDNSSIPSVREMAIALGVNPNTVAKAYRELERLGYIYSRPGIGMFVNIRREEIEEMILQEIESKLKAVLKIAVRQGISLNKCWDIFDKIAEEVKNERSDTRREGS